MKIFDCTTYFDEKMMMEARFNILDKYVHKFIVVESIFSHSGEEKKLNFNIDDYPKFKDKINYIIIEKQPSNLFTEEKIKINPIYKRLNSIKRIEQSYNFMSQGLTNAGDEDLIMISDNDEIPNLNKIKFDEIKNNFLIFNQLFFYYKFNLLYDKIIWPGTKACRKKILKSFSSLKNLKNKKYPFWRFDTYFSDIKQINLNIIEEGGWHFTNLKSPEDLYQKFNNFGHHDEFESSNITIEKLRLKIKNKEVFYDHFADKNSKAKWDYNYKLKKIDDSILPNFLIENKNKFKEWFD
jgi:beta-1,4-mannosyl-glycoprotein beta-1,4-N-acetylglucosaminyltransferase